MTTEARPQLRSGWSVDLSSQTHDAAWDSFLESAPGGHYVQSSAWAQTKAVLGWHARRVVARQGTEIVGGVQVLITSKPVVGGLAFASKGPVLGKDDPDLERLLVEQLKELVSREGIRYLALQPPGGSVTLDLHLRDAGFLPSCTDRDLAPVSTVVLDVRPSEDDLLAQMRKKTRQYIRKGPREGLVTRVGGVDDLAGFYRLLAASAQRLDFEQYPLAYFERMWEVFSGADQERPRIGLMLADVNHEPVAALLVLGHGDTVTTRAIGWSGEFGSHRPNEAVYWAAIQWAKANGYHSIDLEGIDNEAAGRLLRGDALTAEMRQTPTFFKTGFGGQVVRRPGPLELIPSPVLGWGYRKVVPQLERSDLMNQLVARIRMRNN